MTDEEAFREVEGKTIALAEWRDGGCLFVFTDGTELSFAALPDEWRERVERVVRGVRDA